MANKTIISASIAFNVACVRDLPVMGIRTLTKADIAHFASRGFSVKLLGQGVRRGNSYAVAVEPVAVTVSSLEANVPSNFNLATVEGATVGELKFYGQGAGSLPTGNAMVQDLLDPAMTSRPTSPTTLACSAATTSCARPPRSRALIRARATTGT